MFISIYFRTSSCESDPEINTFIYGPPPTINSGPVCRPRWTDSDWTHGDTSFLLSLPVPFYFSVLLPSVQQEVSLRILDWTQVIISPGSVWISLSCCCWYFTGSFFAVIHCQQRIKPETLMCSMSFKYANGIFSKLFWSVKPTANFGKKSVTCPAGLLYVFPHVHFC